MSDNDKFNGKRARDLAIEIGEAAREKAEAAFGVAAEATEDAIEDAHVYMRRQMRERPLAVLGAAVGVGVLIGLAMSNSRR